jgi:hypothetical protein
VNGGTLLSTAGLTAGVDATLHLLIRRHGPELAARVAESLHIPPSPFVENPTCRQFEFTPADGIFLLNAAFHWPKPRLSVWLYDGVGELDLGSVVDVYGISAAYHPYLVGRGFGCVEPRDSVCGARAGPDGSPRWVAIACHSGRSSRRGAPERGIPTICV